MSELAEVIKDLKGVKKEIKDIKENHLPSILKEIASLRDTFKDAVRNMRWFITLALLIFAVVLTILQVYG